MELGFWAAIAVAATSALIIAVRRTREVKAKVRLLFSTAYLVPLPWFMMIMPYWKWAFMVYLPIALIGLVASAVYPLYTDPRYFSAIKIRRNDDA